MKDAPGTARSDPVRVAGEVYAAGFVCRRCSECCTDSNLVMVGQPEMQRIISVTGRDSDELFEPYPEFITDENGGCFTFGWCLRHATDGGCIFLEEWGCIIYADRPWICRTYPFMLDGDELLISGCSGLGTGMAWDEALSIARALLARRDAEVAEEHAIRQVFAGVTVPPGRRAVIDSQGMTVLDG